MPQPELQKTLKAIYSFVAIICLLAAYSGAARADDPVEARLTLANHAFDPQELVVPANQKIKLTIVNKDPTPAEFESEDLGREKVVPPNGEIYVYLGPLDPGSYGYFDDFHRTSAVGKITAQ